MKLRNKSPLLHHNKPAGVSRLATSLNLGVRQELRNKMHASNPTCFRSTLHSALQLESKTQPKSYNSNKFAQACNLPKIQKLCFSSPDLYKSRQSHAKLIPDRKPLSSFYFGDLESDYPASIPHPNSQSHSRIFNKRGSFSKFSHEYIQSIGKHPFKK